MEIGYDTVLYVLIAMTLLPCLVFKPFLLVYPIIIMTMLPALVDDKIQLGPVNIFALDLVIAFLCICIGYVVFVRCVKKERIFGVTDDSKPILLAMFFYIAMHLLYLLAGYYQGVEIDSGIRRFLHYAGFFYFFLPVLFIKNNNQLKYVLFFIVLIISIFPGWQIFRFMAKAHYAQAITSSGTIRITTAGIPLMAAGLFVILAWNRQIRYYFLAVCPIVSILFSGHRSAFLAVAISLMILFYFKKEFTKPIMFLYFTGFSLLIALLGIEIFTGHSFYDDALKRSVDTVSVENPTTKARLYSIEDNLYVFKIKPLFGIGYNHEILPALFDRPDYNSRNIVGYSDLGGEFNVLHPHNFMLRFLSHTGIMGTSAILTIIFLVFKRCHRLIRKGGNSSNVGIFILCSLVFFIIFSLMNTSFSSEAQIFWILCGAAAMYRENEDQMSEEGVA